MKTKHSQLLPKLILSAFGVLYSKTALAAASDVQGYLGQAMYFINNIIIPLLFSIALLFFLINAARYFIIGGADSDSQAKAKLLALYGIGAFVFLVSIWGIVNMIVGGLGIANTQARCPDYLGNWCESRGYGNGSNTLFRGSVEIDVQIDLNGRPR